MEETLICHNGNHPFTRERKRGPKPKFCPQHAPIIANDGDDEVEKPASTPKIKDELEQRIQRVLASTNVNRDAKDKLRYAYEQVKKGRELYFMNQVINDVLRQEERQLRLQS